MKRALPVSDSPCFHRDFPDSPPDAASKARFILVEGKMEYRGVNKAGFDNDARLLVDFYGCQPEGTRDEYGRTFEDCARELAKDYGIGDSEIWDLLPEYEDLPGLSRGKA